MLLKELSRVEPGSAAYELLLDKLNQVSDSDELSAEEQQKQQLQKRLKAISHISKMPWWFQAVFFSVLIFGLVWFIDSVGFWFGFDLLQNDPPPAHLRRSSTQVYPTHSAPRIK